MNSIPIRIIPGASPAAVLDMSDDATGLGLPVIRIGNYMVVLTEEEPEPSKEELCPA